MSVRVPKTNLRFSGTPTAHSADGRVQFSIAGGHRPLARGGHVAAAGRLLGLVVFPVGIRHFFFSQPSEAAALRKEKENSKSEPLVPLGPPRSLGRSKGG